MSKVRSTGQDSGESLIRIGELARRAGVPAATLRAWERRYGVVEPCRGSSGYRLYTEGDERRLRSMADLIDQGLAPAEAAARVLRGGTSTRPPSPPAATAGAAGVRSELLDALLAFDGGAAERLIDRALAVLSSDAFVADVVLPILRDLGDGWASGEVSVAQEHFASGLLRGRMLGLARSWGDGGGPLALLACAPGELHDLGLVAFGLVLRGRGWRIAFLGADAPIGTIRACAEELEPDVVVVCALTEAAFDGVAGELTKLAARSSLLLAGAGAGERLADRVGAKALSDDPVGAAHSLAP